MQDISKIEKEIFNITSNKKFNDVSIKLLHYHYQYNELYRDFVDNLRVDILKVSHYSGIPCMPISFFKQHQVKTFLGNAEAVFSSSGTTGKTTSKHYVKKTGLYEKSFIKGFEYFFENIEDYILLALLPSYLEQGGSSLVYMVNKLIKLTGHKDSGFYLHDKTSLIDALIHLTSYSKKNILLIGVSFALLDIAEDHILELPSLQIMETGGMKGRRKEITRRELHEKLAKGFGTKNIYSEYGMTELMSQAYSKENGFFRFPPWAKVLVRDINDPLTYLKPGSSGGINIIDLANMYSCPFISTEDLGKLHADGSFEVLGRYDHSDVRGCNLLI